jgi:hypothetical protein
MYTTNGRYGELAAQLFEEAKEEFGEPSHANTLALIGIGNALLQVAERLGNLGDLEGLRAMTGCLDEIAHRP